MKVVAIDGPAGSGKSTVARLLAERLGWSHLDTGAFYRAATLAIIRSQGALNDHSAAATTVAMASFDQVGGRMLLDEEDVSAEIRTASITRSVSAVAAIGEVRRHMVMAQRAWVERCGRGAVVEGRDIGSVVFPDAILKVYLDADPLERARRRAGELGLDASQVAAALAERDAKDSTRDLSPLSATDDSYVLDTTHMTLEEVVNTLAEELERRLTPTGGN